MAGSGGSGREGGGREGAVAETPSLAQAGRGPQGPGKGQGLVQGPTAPGTERVRIHRRVEVTFSLRHSLSARDVCHARPTLWLFLGPERVSLKFFFTITHCERYKPEFGDVRLTISDSILALFSCFLTTSA